MVSHAAVLDSAAQRGTWKLDGGGALMNQAIHSIDLLTWFMGPVVEIRAQTATLAHERIAVEDTAVATLRSSPTGHLGVVEGEHRPRIRGYLKRIELRGSAGTAAMEEEDIVKWDFAEKLDHDGEVHSQMAKSKSGGGERQRPDRDRPSWSRQAISRRRRGDSTESQARRRWPRGSSLGRNHLGHLSSGSNRQAGTFAPGQGPHA